MRLGVISDTHGLLRPEAVRALLGSDVILHAGDVGAPEILSELARIAPVRAVRGNNDAGPWAATLPERELLRADGVTLLLVHDVKALRRVEPDVRVVVAGHSHRARNQTLQGVLYFNPGSAGPRRFTLPITVGRLDLLGGTVLGIILDVGPGS